MKNTLLLIFIHIISINLNAQGYDEYINAGLKGQSENNYEVAGSNFSIADITSFAAIDFVKRAEVMIPENCQHLARWYAEVSSRESAKS